MINRNSELKATLTADSEVDLASTLDEANLDRFSQRMIVLINSFGSLAEVARKCGFAESTVKKWADGISDPSRGRCIALARGTGASLLWIVAGEEPMWEKDRALQTASQGHSQAVRLDDMTMALQLVEEALEGKTMPREKRAELIALVYDGVVDGLPEAKLLRWARTVAG